MTSYEHRHHSREHAWTRLGTRSTSEVVMVQPANDEAAMKEMVRAMGRYLLSLVGEEKYLALVDRLPDDLTGKDYYNALLKIAVAYTRSPGATIDELIEATKQ